MNLTPRDIVSDSEMSQLLTSLQFSDSAFPSGFYTLSHSLEGYSQAGLVHRGDILALLGDLLVHSIGPGDATALAVAHRAAVEEDWETVQAADQRLFASKLNADMRQASLRTGRQLVDLANQVIGGAAIDEYARRLRAGTTPGCQPVVTALVYASTGVPTVHAVGSDLFAFAASYVGASLRLKLTDHRLAHAVLRDIAPVIERVAIDASQRRLADVGGSVPVSDITSAQHERADASLFAT